MIICGCVVCSFTVCGLSSGCCVLTSPVVASPVVGEYEHACFSKLLAPGSGNCRVGT